MERLTKIDGIGQNEAIKCFGCGIETAGADLEHCGYCEHWRAILDRLAEYEDTGFTPDEVRAYKDAEEQGLLVRLPCKVGTKVYRANNFFGKKSVSEEEFDIDSLDQFGSRVFLTREEAEAALKEANRNAG